MPPMGAPVGYMAGPYGGYPPPMAGVMYPPMAGLPLGYPYAPQMGFFPGMPMPHPEGVPRRVLQQGVPKAALGRGQGRL
jgi:hypothetical protein